ncbi:uncharacterized protein A4U43_C09F1280 [Asparagus officinalis]|uniref:non-specific serine/threonine protein kinase n=1 Tax=Asparagus officinalis TaxID=4686 RepID=A0A5P1E4E5_ASPOF|nr:receptor protein kinase TMK1-like [Asparagus officinalis]ONK57514.1 uncharacterized protein A4U43_C09F1280 [Asparagus officinalis]
MLVRVDSDQSKPNLAAMVLIKILSLAALLLHCSLVVLSATDPDDLAVLNELRKGLENPELLNWPENGDDPCGPPLWPHVYCSGSRVSQIQVQNLGLTGPLPQSFNKLSMLSNIGLQRNNFYGGLPSFAGLSNLQFAYLGGNRFDTIPSDFFVGLTSLQVLSLDDSPLNKSTGWSLPKDFESSAQLTNLSLIGCNLVGPLPEFLGGMQSLRALKLSYNNLSGEIPASFSGSMLQILWLNNQNGDGLSGDISVISSVASLSDAWLHGNSFTGSIPSEIGECTSLTRLWLNDNKLVGLIPENLVSLPQLESLQLDNNRLMGPIPKVKFNFTYADNSFCQSIPGVSCSPEVSALLDFLGGVNYPEALTSSWSGNDPCSMWLGVSCSNGKVFIINLPNYKLNGSISPSIGKLGSLADIKLGGNNLIGKIPDNLTRLKSLRMLNVSANNLRPPVPKFGNSVKLLIDGNPLLNPSSESPVAPPHNNPSSEPPITPPGNNPSSPDLPSPSRSPDLPSPSRGSTSLHRPLAPSGSPVVGNNSSSPSGGESKTRDEKRREPKSLRNSKLLILAVPAIIGVLMVSLVGLLFCCRRRGNNSRLKAPGTIVVYPRDPSNPDDMLKIVVANNNDTSSSASDLKSVSYSTTSEAQMIESGNFMVSVQVLRNLTRNFSTENEVGRGGFGVVYKGELHDGTTIAVKRMEAAMTTNKAFDEFKAEIAVLSKVRHRNLVSLLGYSIEGNERILVYEYVPQGALSKHLFQWKHLNLEPLSWKKRLNIALDVSRGLEYLHNLTHQCFIHRDLKSSNILLGDDYRAKISDFGLVKLAPDGKNSVATRLAGTFGYLAPEYAVTGKITTKADVFSFGVVLMELITGLAALDETRSEENQYLASWFIDIKSNKTTLKSAIDPSIEDTEETFESISIISELAGHCAAREPHQRPDMGHVVSVLSPLVEKWKPMKDDEEGLVGIDLQQPLLQMVKGWQAADGGDNSVGSSSNGLDDSKGSIPARPPGFGDSFTSADGR